MNTKTAINIEQHLKMLQERNLKLQEETYEIIKKNQKILTALEEIQSETHHFIENKN